MIKNLFFLFIVLFTHSLQAVKVTSANFFVCFHKTVEHVKIRTIRTHQFPDETKCVVVYSIDGQDQIVSQAGWLSFCEKKAKQLRDKLQEQGLWRCESQYNQVEIFYAFPESTKEGKTPSPL